MTLQQRIPVPLNQLGQPLAPLNQLDQSPIPLNHLRKRPVTLQLVGPASGVLFKEQISDLNNNNNNNNNFISVFPCEYMVLPAFFKL